MRVLIAAGNTREMIDPVRYISNISTGRMGLELAKESVRRKNPTVLVSGPTLLQSPRKAKVVPIVTSRDLERSLKTQFPRCDVLFMPSAVCDFRPAKYSKAKIKRTKGFSLKLAATPDLLRMLGKRKKRKILVGFCLETGNLVRNARRKLKEKELDYIVANRMGGGVMPFGDSKTSVVILRKDGEEFHLRDVTKKRVSRFLFDLVEETFSESSR